MKMFVRVGGVGLFIAVVSVISVSYYSRFFRSGRASHNTAVTQSQTPYTPTPTIKTLFPDRLVIPKLGIDTPVEVVGVTPTGAMGVPKDAKRVGWYRFGPTPSERGNAVIAGHFDTPTGRPAIFYRLNALRVGDTVTVVLTDQTEHEFVVTGKELVSIDTFPTDYVFATKYGINLNLITCGGVWDAKAKNYDKRLVIYTTQKGSEFSTLQ